MGYVLEEKVWYKFEINPQGVKYPMKVIRLIQDIFKETIWYEYGKDT